MHITLKHILILTIAILIVIPAVSATAGNYTASRGSTDKGPYGIMVSLGIEEAVPTDWVALLYNWVSVLGIMFIIGLSSLRGGRFFLIFAVIFAAIFAWWGWYTASSESILWMWIIAAALLAVAIYMKESNRFNWGSGGPGTTINNMMIILIMMQIGAGVANTSQIWSEDEIPTPEQYQSISLDRQLTGVSGAGGFDQNAVTTGAIILETGIAAIKTVLSIMLTLIAFGPTVYLIYPWVQGSALAVAIIGMMQFIIWFLYIRYFMQIFWKPMPDSGDI
jgi:hypothetical protein